MGHQDEDMVRRALADEALGYRPSAWAEQAAGVHERGLRRRRRARGAVAVAVGAAAVAVALTGTPDGTRRGPTIAAPALSQAPSASARPSVHPTASAAPSVAAVPWPTVRVVPAGQDLDFGHQIWMRLTDARACEGMGPAATRAYSCNSVTDGNQPQGTVSMRESGDATGTLYSPLYLGPGDAARMTVTVHGGTHRATVVTLAGHPGYATGYLWLPLGARGAGDNGAGDNGAGGSGVGGNPTVQVTVYDAQGNALAETEVPGM
ncbi:hypothetical protein [Streptacidiphilus sp. P02-A3a]|uniref:hypothetical protein n=1 Tax=Streptacidiphilus sp. P02-A3a TaxID=2704468 RepID=UPI0015FDA779|nr:hypothetical protein [Streptacidiphilus sp. P02-A3a]QMU73028.1 hypothetical protein GXP74_37090 [Streptacidiphilus sp. P02-A3a]